jgi:hypothetical protein
LGRNGAGKRKFYSFLKTVSEFVPFFGLCAALEHAGYVDLSRELIDGRDINMTVVCRGVLKRELPNAKRIHSYYTHLKRSADNNVFENQTCTVLNEMITSLGNKLCQCSDINTLQLLADKRCVLYFLLCQQFPCVSERNKVLMKMRDSMPRGVDRTVFDTIFHSYMAFNWAITGNADTADKHEKQARIACSNCVAGFVSIVLAQWSQYKNNILYLKSDCTIKPYFHQAKESFQTIQQCLEDIEDIEDQNTWKTISVLDILRLTVGINPRLDICDISRIDDACIRDATAMLRLIDVPRDIRRRMYYYVIRGRLLEKTDPLQAKTYVSDALELARDGCYDNGEKNKIENYLRSLNDIELPSPTF